MTTFEIPDVVYELANKLEDSMSITEFCLRLSQHGITVTSASRNTITSCLAFELVRDCAPILPPFDSGFETATLVTGVKLK